MTVRKEFNDTAESLTPAVEVGVNDAIPAAEAPVGGLPVETPESALARVSTERDELKDRYLRLAAEYDNFRKRSQRERAEAGERGQAELLS